MIKAIKIRIYPTKSQEQKLWKSVGAARFIYNWVLNRQKENYNNGNSIIKLEHKLKLLWRKIVHIRNNYNHHLTSYVIKKLPYKIVIEDLNIKGMMKNKYLAKAVGEQNFFEIRRQLEYKCKFNGIQLIIADRWYPSSKTCSCCGNIKTDLKLSDRTYKCEKCSLIINRDLNASINLANYTQVS